jgi:Resolvase, N terminal domain
MDTGYARVSTQDLHPALQLDALHAAGCAKVCVEQASGAQRDRPQLQAALDDARPGDTLVVWKLDRLARSLTQLIETIELLATRDIGFRSLTEAIETTTAGGGWCSTSSRAWPSSSGRSSASAPEPDSTPPAGPDGPRAHRRQGDAGGSHPHGRGRGAPAARGTVDALPPPARRAERVARRAGLTWRATARR